MKLNVAFYGNLFYILFIRFPNLETSKKKEVLIMKITSQQLETLRVERGRKNLTISSLAQQLGVSRYTMGNIINGKTNGLRTETVHKINSWLTANVHPTKEVANNE